MRQEPFNLLAWNYPTVYSSVVRSHPTEPAFTRELTRAVGFSPDSLSQALIAGDDPRDETKVSGSPPHTFNPYEEFYDIGKSIARLGMAELNGSAKNDWGEVNTHMWSVVGPKWEVGIRETLEKLSQSYSKILPAYFAELRSFIQKNRVVDHNENGKTLTNKYLKYCQPAVQEALEALYVNMPIGSRARRLLKTFVVNPEKKELTPKTLIGKVRARALAAVDISTIPSASRLANADGLEVLPDNIPQPDAVAGAFTSKDLIVTREGASRKGGITTFACSLGGRSPLGVLYLERPTDLISSEDSQVIFTCQAIAQTLCDVFLIE
jgi:hypothetical protein